jgi:2-polyprenyl-6-methoxyphenol hydroxylase-like FAD-dependent oxidoreductase
MLLARKGYRVLLVDKATFPSDTISTHIIWPHGAEIMDRWGLLDRLAVTGCPPIALDLIFDVGPFALKGAVTDTNGGRGGFCPRRTVLDKLLVDAAVEAGTELREGFTVEALRWDGDRIAGIKGHSRTGGTVEERARVVVGADGVLSLVAKVVRAPEYDVKPPLATNYYSYYSGFEADDIEQYVRDYEAVGCFPTHDGLTLIAVLWPSSRFGEIRTDIEGHVRKVVARLPSVADRLQGAQREEKWFGTAGVPNYFRRPFGPGWALVGDAGYTRDPMRRHWPPRWTMGGPDGARSTTRWPGINPAATGASSRCTTSPVSSRRWNRRRHPCSSSLLPCAATRTPPTSSTPR